MNNPEERELLRQHLTEVHVEMRTIEKIARYDEDAAEVLKVERIRRFDIEKAVRQLVVKFMRLGLKPSELEELIMFGHRCRMAAARGRAVQTNNPENSKDQHVEENEPDTDDD